MSEPTPDVRDASRRGRGRKPRRAHRLPAVALSAARARFLRTLHQAELARRELADAARVFSEADPDGEQAAAAQWTEDWIDAAIRCVEARPVRAADAGRAAA